MTQIRLKRVYEEKLQEDGPWILVERLWPRGIRREKVDLWARDAAPSQELRRWFSHDPARWEEFRRRYMEELSGKDLKGLIEYISGRPVVTFVFAASNREMNSAVVLKEHVEALLRASP